MTSLKKSRAKKSPRQKPDPFLGFCNCTAMRTIIGTQLPSIKVQEVRVQSLNSLVSWRILHARSSFLCQGIFMTTLESEGKHRLIGYQYYS